MASESSTIVQRLWNYCNVLRDDGMSYGDFVEQLTYLLSLKMDDEWANQLCNLSAILSGNNQGQPVLARAARLHQAILQRAFVRRLV